MKTSRNRLISLEQDVKLSGVYNGYLILNALNGQNRITIFDVYSTLSRKSKNFSYSSTMSALVFLYTAGLIDFDAPYIYNMSQTT